MIALAKHMLMTFGRWTRPLTSSSSATRESSDLERVVEEDPYG